MALKPSARPAQALMADVEPAERRSWLSSGMASLAVAALGLAVAGSVSLTTSAQTPVEPLAVTNVAGSPPAAGPTPRPAAPAGTAPSRPAATTQGSLKAFAPRTAAAEQTSRSDQVRIAITKERTAQRAEELLKTAEDVSRAARDASSKAREQNLAATDRATRENAVRLAQQRLRDAVAARLAAQSARQQAENSATQTAPATSVDPTTPATPDVPSGGGSASPVPGAVIGAHFGQYGSWSRYHTGLDFRAGYGTPIRAVTNGVVVFAGNSGDWAGNHIAIRHAGGYTSMSSHMSSMAVRSGATVSAGQVIGYVGQTGRAFGAHLHFEVYPPGIRYGDVYKAVNPVPWLRAQGVNTN